MAILFTNAKLLCKEDDKYIILDDMFLLVKDSYIKEISKVRPQGNFDRIIDCHNKLIMPGLVNAHGHAPMTLVRGVGSGLSLQDWLYKTIFPLEAKMTPADIKAGAKIAIMEMLCSGTTTYSEMYDFPFAESEVIAESGIRANLTRVGLSINEYDELRKQECEDLFDILNGKKVTNEELKRELLARKLPDSIAEKVKDGHIKVDFSIHSEYLTNEKFVKEIVKSNKDRKTRIQIHISETVKEHNDSITRHGKTPTKYLYDLGLLDGGLVYAAHCVHVSDEDLEILKKTNTSIVYNPASNMKLGSGFAPIKKAYKMGINVALGTDGVASNDSLDMFKEMHLAALLNAGINNDPTTFTVDQIIDMATVNGAKALGREDIGEIRVGYKADLIMLDLSSINLLGCKDYKTAIVYSVNPSNVVMTMVNGDILYENNKFTTIDKEKASREFIEAIKRIYR